jgi:hypothetical protein
MSLDRKQAHSKRFLKKANEFFATLVIDYCRAASGDDVEQFQNRLRVVANALGGELTPENQLKLPRFNA